MKQRSFLRIGYQVIMALLAVVSITLLLLDYSHEINITTNPYSYVDNAILIIFAVDYVVRLLSSKKKLSFIKNNIWDLLAIIPVNQIFYIFRFARISRAFRLLKFIRIFRLVGLTGKLGKFMKINGLLYYVYISIGVLFVGASIYCISEKVSFFTALWWSITTATTVGYGDVSPTTDLGKFAAVILMFVGIGFIGMLTSSITSFFAKEEDDDVLNELERLREENKEINKKLDRLLKNNNISNS